MRELPLTAKSPCSSLASKFLDSPRDLSMNKHQGALHQIRECLLKRAGAGRTTTFKKVKSHIGINDNEAADKLATEAAKLGQFDRHYHHGSHGLIDVCWPCITRHADFSASRCLKLANLQSAVKDNSETNLPDRKCKPDTVCASLGKQ